ncbi:putative capsular polysaccharide biosynthesis protein YwqC [Paenibacillus solanacearum]|uniref:Capsular polysaccharide biosynthesis protein YwqC n=2 Tax=Paenibacillus solanacearum TaxID=2048548 RepID=A0A916NNI8_9BACL|nr:Wzz/FepE/Etk N-terminal domain-containing protein [Paenibacillus solanacearum]CAG7613226.1 putative capsular polysaccharide biosynthesis protein YwqC [Paenibacillus solanacearum]
MELKQYFGIIRKRLVLIILCVIIATLTTAAYSYSVYTPVYQASTKFIVNKTVEIEQMGREQMDLSAVGLNIQLINTYKEIIRTPAIMDKVVQRYPELGLTPDLLSRMINVQSVNNTQVMTLSVADTSYERATKVVNAVSSVFQSEIPKIMKVNNVTILNSAGIDDNPLPINKRSNQYILISAAVSLLFAVGIAFLLDFLDDTLKNEEDIQRLMGAPVLASIPRMKTKHAQRLKPIFQEKRVGDAQYAKVEG